MNWTQTVRSFAAALLLALSVSTCSLRDEPTGPLVVAQGLQVAPLLPPNFSRFAGGLGVDRVHLIVLGQGGNVLVDEVIPFSPYATSMAVQLPVHLASTSEQLLVQLTYEDQAGTPLYTGQQTIQARVGQTVQPPQIPITYVGPGANTYYIQMSPYDSVVTIGDTAQVDVVAYDSASQVIPNVYISWSTDDPNTPVDAYGRVPATGGKNTVIVYAQTPNGSSNAIRMYFAPGAIAVTPDSLELLPGSFQSFAVYGPGQYNSYSWSVNGITGGDSTVGIIDSIFGYYNAPAVLPSPSTVTICAALAADTSCSKVNLATPPTPGGDLAIFSDTYIFTDAALSAQPGNHTFINRLFGFTGTGARSSGGTVLFDRGHGSACFATGVCRDSGLTSLVAEITNLGYAVQRVDTLAPFKNIPIGVKTIVLWNPSQYMSDRETNELKRFARDGGRIVLIADDTTSLGGSLGYSLGTMNDYIYRLGSAGYLNGVDVGCSAPSDVTGPDVRTHQITNGVGTLRMFCGAEIQTSNTYQLFLFNQVTFGVVSKIDLTLHTSYGG